jgi:hypothetical protein
MVVSERSITSSHDDSAASLAIIFKRKESGVIEVSNDLVDCIDMTPQRVGQILSKLAVSKGDIWSCTYHSVAD